jgi:hypothetical protein
MVCALRSSKSSGAVLVSSLFVVVLAPLRSKLSATGEFEPVFKTAIVNAFSEILDEEFQAGLQLG